ncbi:MAG: phage tail tube protein [Candidatus Hodarchaeota archaeon]
MGTYSEWQKRLGIGLEATWTTGVDSTLPIPIKEYPNFQLGRNTIESDSLTGMAYNRIDVQQRVRGRNAPTVSLTFDVNCDYIVYFLYALFQRVWESATSPYPKTYVPYAKNPDFAAKSSASYPCLLSVVGDNRIDSEGHKIDGALCSNLKFECEEGGILQATAVMQGRNMATNDATQTGDDFTSFSTAAPLLWENAKVLLARQGATAGVQGTFAITGADATEVVVAGDQTSYIATGNYITFGITISASNDCIVIEEDTGNTVAVTIDTGVYSPYELCLELEEKINLESDLANTYYVSFDPKDRKFLFTRNTGSLDFRVDEEDGSQQMNGTLGFDGSNDAVGTTYTSDTAITWNANAYPITNVAYSTSTTVTVALDRDPTEATVPQSIQIWHDFDSRGFNLELINNVASHFWNATTVQNHTLGRFTGSGSLIMPWGQYSTDENKSLNDFIAGYRTPIIIYWAGLGEDDNDFMIFMNAYYTGANETEDIVRMIELPFDLVRDDASNRVNLPCYIIATNGTDLSWTVDG